MSITRSRHKEPRTYMLVSCCFRCLTSHRLSQSLSHSVILLSVVEEIESLPLSNTPEVMGLHSNAEIGYYTQAAKDMWCHLIDLQPQTGVIS